MSALSMHLLLHRLKVLFIGGAKDYKDSGIFHKISLIAVLAWVGLGADGLSSSCYGPQEAFLTLGRYHYLGIFVALGTALTISVISMSYSQTIELFPSGGGGYLVSSKLHSPLVGMISGSALLIDYILTVSVSVASGADAVFSFISPTFLSFKIYFAILGVVFLILLNMRGVKESISILAPIFLIFVLTHLFAILYTLMTHASDYNVAIYKASGNIAEANIQLGFWGMIFLILKAFTMGAGTFTGIEAVSNGLPVLREPRVKTGKRTMRYMAASLAFTAVGLMFAYFLFGVNYQHGKTLNAVLFERIAINWGLWGNIFVNITLISEAAILFVAAQAGFLDGPRILSNMALDRWLPTRFSMLSDRLVIKNGILLIGGIAIAVIILTKGDIRLLVVLYSINVFITFILTESGMVRHWWQVRKSEKKWLKKLSVNATALILDIFILISVVYFKFHEGGWVTILVTGCIVLMALGIKRHYNKIGYKIKVLDKFIEEAETDFPENQAPAIAEGKDQYSEKTAIILVNGYNGLGLHALLNILVNFKDVFKRFIFVQVGVIDTGSFKGAGDVAQLSEHIKNESQKYVDLMLKKGYAAESYTVVGTELIEEIYNLVSELREFYWDAIIFSGQLAFEKDTFFTRLLHNNLVFPLQKKFINHNIPFVIFPVKI